MVKFPIGLQDFRSLREEGYLYIDKTEQVYRLIQSSKFFFLSRPRRFGKSLTVSTLHELYRGNRAVFSGLWVEKYWDWERQHPIIWLRFALMDYEQKGLEAAILEQLATVGKSYQIVLEQQSAKGAFAELIQKMAAQGQRTVVLIDEYDKPLVDDLEDTQQVDARRKVLRSFYSVLKDLDPYLELVFITGVSAFSKVSLFSALNNLTNVTLGSRAEDLVGITEAEIDRYLAPHLGDLSRDDLRRWYNGYSWTGKVRVYNPFSLLSALYSGEIFNFWFDTGTPNFLIQLLKRAGIYDVGKFLQVSQHRLTSFDPENIDLASILFQTGYLTIVDRDEFLGRSFDLDYPNLEVRESMQTYLLQSISPNPDLDARGRAVLMARALIRHDLDLFIEHLNALFANIPYDFWSRDEEFAFHTVLFLLFELIGVPVETEVHTSKGRADAAVILEHAVYVFEFKRDQSVASALKQIRERDYLDKYGGQGRKRYAVGIKFSSKKRSVADWVVEEVIPNE